jgi:outer membrane protein assembly factor BamB
VGTSTGTWTRRQVVGAWAAGGTAVAALGLGLGLSLESGRKPHAGGRQVRWKVSFDVYGESNAYEEDVSTADAAAVVAGTTVYTKTGATLHAFDTVDGRRRWGPYHGPYQGGSPTTRLYTVPVVAADGGTVYLTHMGDVQRVQRDTLCALDAATGAVRWTYLGGPTSSHGDPTPCLTGGGSATVCFSTDSGVTALDPATGQVRWRHDDQFPVGPVAYARGLVLAYRNVFGDAGAGASGTVLALAAATGAVRWRRDLRGGESLRPIVTGDGVLYVCESSGYAGAPSLSALDLTTGAIRWAVEPARPVRRGWLPAGTPDTTLCLAAEGAVSKEVAAFDTSTGRQRWTFRTAGTTWGRPAVAGRTVYVTAGRGLYAVDAATGRRQWTFQVPARAYGPAVAGGTAYVFDRPDPMSSMDLYALPA